MFPKLLRNAKLEDVEKENPTLLDNIKEIHKSEFEKLISSEYIAKGSVEIMQARITELESTLTALTNENKILMGGISQKQGDLALSLIKEGKSSEDALLEISKASASLASFESSAPVPAGNGSSSDAQTVDTKEKAIDVVLRANEGISRANAIQMARRQYPDLFVSQNLLNHKERGK